MNAPPLSSPQRAVVLFAHGSRDPLWRQPIEAVALRMVEVRGGAGEVCVRWGFPVEAVHAADLFEQPADLAGFVHDAASGTTTFTVRPFQIVTLRAGLAGGGAG